MPLTITGDSMSGDHTSHTARLVPGHPDAWEVSWLPGRLMTRNAAITAMVLADTARADPMDDGHRLWPHIQGWAAELGLTTPDALARISRQSESTSAEKDGAAQADREAAG
jgi:hypothetical protein